MPRVSELRVRKSHLPTVTCHSPLVDSKVSITPRATKISENENFPKRFVLELIIILMVRSRQFGHQMAPKDPWDKSTVPRVALPGGGGNFRRWRREVSIWSTPGSLPLATGTASRDLKATCLPSHGLGPLKTMNPNKQLSQLFCKSDTKLINTEVFVIRLRRPGGLDLNFNWDLNFVGNYDDPSHQPFLLPGSKIQIILLERHHKYQLLIPPK